MDASMDELSIEIESTTKDSASAIDLLIGKLDKLRLSLQNVVKESSNLSQLKNNLENVSKNISTKTKSMQGVQTSPFSRYGTLQQQSRSLGINPDKLGDEGYARLSSRIKTTNEEISKYVMNNNKVITVSKSTKNGGNVAHRFKLRKKYLMHFICPKIDKVCRLIATLCL